jgi:hypothetical protein
VVYGSEIGFDNYWLHGCWFLCDSKDNVLLQITKKAVPAKGTAFLIHIL